MFSAVLSMCWLPQSATDESGAHVEQRVVASTADGSLVCADCTGQVVAETRINTSIQCLAAVRLPSHSQRSVDTVALIVGGGKDGSIRLWRLHNRSFEEVSRVPAAHPTAGASVISGKKAGGGDGSSVATSDDGCTAIAACRPSVSSRDQLMATGGADGSIKLWKFIFL